MEKLTEEQRTCIENSMWVVNTVLKERGLQTDQDLRQSATLYMCECILRYDPTKNVKWTTYAYKSVAMFVQREKKKEVMANEHNIAIDPSDLAGLATTDFTTDIDRILTEILLSGNDPLQAEIWHKFLEGYNLREIGEQLGMNRRKVGVELRKAREFLKGENQYEYRQRNQENRQKDRQDGQENCENREAVRTRSRAEEFYEQVKGRKVL